jgi:hypothetical protein
MRSTQTFIPKNLHAGRRVESVGKDGPTVVDEERVIVSLVRIR